MPPDSSSSRYTPVAIAMHWLLAVLIVATFLFGLFMTSLEPSPAKLRYYNWHKWAGATILALSALRLLWRLGHRPPRDLAMPRWQRRTAHATHWALYALFFAVPLVGWAYSSAAGYPVVVYGVLPLPDFVSPDKALAAAIKPWHGRLAYTLAALVVLHVAGAAKHHYIDRDDLLSRMRPGRALP
jgi:cytochrome b561